MTPPLDAAQAPSAHPEGCRFSDPDVEAVSEIARARQEILAEVEKRIVGQRAVIDRLLVSLFARGHALLVGVPGLAKTLLVSTLAEVLDLSHSRIQFTPDLMPSDITGTDVLEEDHTTGKRSFRFIRGPIFANLVLADEINRAPPKTQAALLQSMQELRVTAGGSTYPLALPFLVFATQNPIEHEGTYPLPEAQLDRFMFQIDVGYPSAADEVAIVAQTTSGPMAKLRRILAPERILALCDLVMRVPAADHVVRHAVEIVRASRPREASAPDAVRAYVQWGAGPRASQHLVLAGKAKAILEGRYAVSIDDVRDLVRPVLQHRLVLGFRAESEGVRTTDVIDALLASVRPS
ncbi:MAG: MoxR family ATPase [Myxococcota bacterium]